MLYVSFVLDLIMCILNAYAAIKTEKMRYFLWTVIFFALTLFVGSLILEGIGV